MSRIRVIVSILCLLFSYSSFAQSSQHQYLIDAGIPTPQPGDTVCQAYLGDYNWRGPQVGEGAPFVRALPRRLCRYGKDIGELEVVALGDFYTYGIEYNSSNTSTDDEREVCSAQVEVNGQPNQPTLRQLPVEYCAEGSEILFLSSNDTVFVGTVRAVGDYYFTNVNQATPDYELITREGAIERIIRTSYNTGIEL